MRHTASSAALPAATIVDVLVPVALDQSLFVSRAGGARPQARGDLVQRCRSATREATGVVWADHVEVRPGLHNRLKDVVEKLDLPPLRPELRALVDWVAGYTLSSRGMVLRMALRMGEHLGAERIRIGVACARARRETR